MLRIATVLLILAASVTTAIASNSSRTAGANLNPIQVENQRPGTTTWQITQPALHGEIAGYASQVSAQSGDRVHFSVRTTAPTFRVDMYRMGWYGGAGAREVLSLTSVVGHAWSLPKPDVSTGLIVPDWPPSFSIRIPSTFLSGMYLLKLTASTGFQSYIPLIIRDQRPSTFVFIHAATTDEAYNGWGGKSLYGGKRFSPRETLHNNRAVLVTFARPFTADDGAGEFFWWEYPMVRWLERNGYDVSYAADLDIHENPGLLLRHRGILVVGHNEYWSATARNAYENAVAHGVNLAVFGANTGYWAVRYQPLQNTPDRIVVCYRYPDAQDPMLKTDRSRVTSRWQDWPLKRPISMLLADSYGGQNYHRKPVNWVIRDPKSWVFAGTGVHLNSSVGGLVGQEYDSFRPGSPAPSHVDILSVSPVMNAQGHQQLANSTLYTARSGARVFNAGTVQWSWGLDDFSPPFALTKAAKIESPIVQRVTDNLLANFARGAHG